MPTCIHMHVFVHVHTYTSTYIHRFLYTSFFIFICSYLSPSLSLYIYIYIYTYTYTYIYMCIYTYNWWPNILILFWLPINSEVECAAGLGLGSPHLLVSIRIAASHLLENEALLCATEWKLWFLNPLVCTTQTVVNLNLPWCCELAFLMQRKGRL